MDIENKPYSLWAAIKNWWSNGRLSKEEMWGDFPKKMEAVPYEGDAFKPQSLDDIIARGQKRAKERQNLGVSQKALDRAQVAASRKFTEVTSFPPIRDNPDTHLADGWLLNPLNPLGAVIWAEALTAPAQDTAPVCAPDNNQTVADSCPAPAIDNTPAPSYEPPAPSYDPPASTYEPSQPSYDNSSSYDSGSNTVDTSSSW